MQSIYKILFIDDEVYGSRKSLIESIDHDDRFEVEPLHPCDIDRNINTHIAGGYDLIIVDYKLSYQPNENDESFQRNGYSVTSYYKEKLPSTPVYLISQILEQDVTIAEHYDKMLSHNFLTKEEGRDYLAADCHSYSSLKQEPGLLSTFEYLATLMQTPAVDLEALQLALPREYRYGIKENATIESEQVQDKERGFIRFAKWINQWFVARSGPLINRTEAAILFGLNTEYFEEQFYQQHKDDLVKCEYTGLFASSNEKRWWGQSIFNFAVSIADDEFVSEPWKSIPSKYAIDQKYWAKCSLCGEYYPECVALDSDEPDLSVVHPAHWHCTAATDAHDEHVGFNPVLYLDDAE